MGSQAEMTEYERRRLENIKRNGEMLAALKIRSKLSDLSAASAKRQSVQSKPYKRIPEKKLKTESPVVLRRSLRARGVPPDAAAASGLDDGVDIDKQNGKSAKMNFNKQGHLTMKDAYRGDDGMGSKLIDIILGSSRGGLLNEGDAVARDSTIDSLVNAEGSETSKPGTKVWGSVNLETLKLKSENVAWLVPGGIMSLRFFPARDIQMIAAGNNLGDVGFWHVNGKEEDGNGIHLYHPHSGHVSEIVIDPFSISKVYSSCYDGFIRLMEVEKEVFATVYHSEYRIYSMSLNVHDRKSLYFSEGRGGFNKWDLRAGKSSLSCDLHENRINTIDFNSDNENLMATSSSDGTACIWDLRLMNTDNTTPLTTVRHKRAVYSSYFSPSGKFLATTSLDENIGVSSGSNYENTSMVPLYNQSGRWISTFRGIWGWDDSTICIGSMKRGVDVISVAGKGVVATLESDLVSAIPWRFDAHPYSIGMLAGATSQGQVYIWTQP